MVTHEDLNNLKKKYAKRRLTRGRAIKLYCKYVCCANDYKSWKDCTQTGCFLWAFRMGKEITPKKEVLKKSMCKTSHNTEKTTKSEGVSA